VPRVGFKYNMIKLTSVKNSKKPLTRDGQRSKLVSVRNTLNRCYRGNAGPMKKLHSFHDLKQNLQIPSRIAKDASPMSGL